MARHQRRRATLTRSPSAIYLFANLVECDQCYRALFERLRSEELQGVV